MNIMEKLLFCKIKHFNPDWAQNFLLLGIHSTHFHEIFQDVKTLNAHYEDRSYKKEKRKKKKSVFKKNDYKEAKYIHKKAILYG